MRKLQLVIISLFLVIPFSVDADSIYNMNIKVDIQKDGSADVVETWDVKASSGSEWYKAYNNLQNIEISNFTVSMDGKTLKYKNWNVDESLNDKKGYYGINNTGDGVELCFGKYDMERHSFTMKYTMSNFVFNTEDAQVTYFTLLPNATTDRFNVNITSYYSFPDTLDVWGYGYKGYAYVKDGKITLTSDNGLNDEYVVVLARFGKGTFNTNNTYEQFKVFDDVLEIASQGTSNHVKSTNESNTSGNSPSSIKEQTSLQNQKKSNNNTKFYLIYVVGAAALIIIGGILYFLYKKKHNKANAKPDSSNNQSSINNSQINSTKLLIFVVLFIGIIIYVLVLLYYIPFGSRAGDVREAKESAVKYFQLFNTSSRQIHCKPKELEGDIILVKCETTDDQLISYFNSSTLWYGFLPSADGAHYWDYGADTKELVIEYLRDIKNN